MREVTAAEAAMMRIALAEAQQALDEGEVPVGAVIAMGDTVIAAAHNRRENSFDPTAHAEVLAIRQAAEALKRRRLSGCTLYVTLEPCPMCAGAVLAAGLDRVVYGAPDEERGCTGSVYRITEDPAFTHFAPADGGVLAGECRELLNTFFARRRAK